MFWMSWSTSIRTMKRIRRNPGRIKILTFLTKSWWADNLSVPTFSRNSILQIGAAMIPPNWTYPKYLMYIVARKREENDVWTVQSPTQNYLHHFLTLLMIVVQPLWWAPSEYHKKRNKGLGSSLWTVLKYQAKRKSNPFWVHTLN